MSDTDIAAIPRASKHPVEESHRRRACRAERKQTVSAPGGGALEG